MENNNLKNTIIDGNLCALDSKNGFKFTLSFKYLLEYWQKLDKESPFYLIYESKIKKLIDTSHILNKDIDDISSLDKEQETIKDLMSIIFPPLSSDNDISGAFSFNFTDKPIYITEGYRKTFATFENNDERMGNNDFKEIACKRLLLVYGRILKEFYNFDFFFDPTIIARIENNENKLVKYFKTDIDDRFLRIRKKGALPELSNEDRKTLSENLNNIPLLLKIIPPKHFELHGFIIIHKTDVTNQETMSEIKRELLNKNSILNKNNFMNLQNMIRSLLNKQHINISVAALHNDKVLLLNSGIEKCNDIQCIYRESNHIPLSEYIGSVFDAILEEKKILLTNNYPEYYEKSKKTKIDEDMLRKGVKSLIVRPLILSDKIIGVFMMGSENLYEFDPLNLMKMEEIYPLFTLVIERALEDFENNVESLVQTHFTSIHPSIEWKFKRAAMNLIDNAKNGVENEMEKIIFEDVYPLYCATDIRGSSTQRNSAIQTDLQDHLLIVKDIIESANNIKKLPILDEYVYRINKYISDLSDGLISGDELEIIGFLHREIETCFNDLKTFDNAIKDKINKYNDILDPELGTFYRRRKDFDESVDLINKTISAYLDKMQIEAQKMFPHYFDKNTTDGVDQNIYIGKSITDKSKFDKLYLKNLRLWQIIVLSNIGRLTDKLKAKLKVQLETTHLIVVQDMPLTLVFKTDEKKLAVEGAYNIRYEIMKKRIDKAVIKETGERLTQIGKIAIVYTQNSEALEYRQYIEFLTSMGYLDGNIEELLLEDLQGIKGLKALRVGINLNNNVDYYSFSEFL